MQADQRRARAIVAGLQLPDPWDVRELCERVAAKRGRPIVLLSRPAMGDSITAMVLAARRADYLFIRDDLAPLHHDHAACHELAHLLAGHVDDKFSGLSPLGDATVRGMSLNRDYTYSDQQELEAEAIATLIMEQVTGRVEVHAPDPGTERAARAFGHALS